MPIKVDFIQHAREEVLGGLVRKLPQLRFKVINEVHRLLGVTAGGLIEISAEHKPGGRGKRLLPDSAYLYDCRILRVPVERLEIANDTVDFGWLVSRILAVLQRFDAVLST